MTEERNKRAEKYLLEKQLEEIEKVLIVTRVVAIVSFLISALLLIERVI